MVVTTKYDDTPVRWYTIKRNRELRESVMHADPDGSGATFATCVYCHNTTDDYFIGMARGFAHGVWCRPCTERRGRG